MIPPPKDFLEFLEKGIVKKQIPNKFRINDLINESDRRFKSFNKTYSKIEIDNENANDAIESCYNIIISLIRAKMLADGYYSSGQGAHEAEVSYLKILGFMEKEIYFMNSLRYFRNGILYYGKTFDLEYANQVKNFMVQLRLKILTMF